MHTSDELLDMGRLAVRQLLTHSPAFGGVALWVALEARPDDTEIAATDGRRMFLYGGFGALVVEERMFVVAHETLHVALLHVPRGQRLRRGGPFRPLVWNAACDAVINESLAVARYMRAPESCVRLDTLLTKEELESRARSQWTSEGLYRLLVSTRSEPELRAIEACGGRDMLPAPADGEPVPASDRMGDTIWRERLTRAQAGDRPSGILRQIAADFPRVETDWQGVLRSHLNNYCSPERMRTWARPSRRWVALGGRTAFERGVSRGRGIRRAGIAIDTSGSIDAKTLRAFVANVNGIQEATGCEILLVEADAAIHRERLFATRLPSDVTFRGGGGTSFVDALARLTSPKAGCDVVVYLTDMYGDFGAKPRSSVPIIWAATTDTAAPFGRVIRIRT